MQDAAKQDVVVWYGLQDALLQEPGGAHAGEKTPGGGAFGSPQSPSKDLQV